MNALDDGILRSWQRCAASGLSMHVQPDYEQLPARSFERIQHQNQALLQAAAPHLEQLHQAIRGAGWSILLTDANCIALRTLASDRLDNPMIADAFQPGSILNEQAIGTSAMSCAMTEQRFTRVFGFEHYNEMHRQFHCAAVPLFDHQGQVCGALDITSENPCGHESIFPLLQQCGRNIQSDMVRQISASQTLSLSVQPVTSQQPASEPMLLALDRHHNIVGANLLATQVLGIGFKQQRIAFSELFENPPKHWARQQTGQLTLHSGLSLHASVSPAPADQFSQAHTLPRSGRPSQQGSTNLLNTPTTLAFGDDRINHGLQTAARMIQRLPVLLLGESGTGKDVAARQLHQQSQRADGPFVSLNCAAIPEHLIESELFGYIAGAFTGASPQGYDGKLQQADGGTLFLDEIGDMPLALQTRLLRVLETREVTPLGGNRSRMVQFQLICATHKDLPAQITQDQFRLDLYYRINGFAMTLPPLRQRQNLPALMDALLSNVAGAGTPRQLAPHTRQQLLQYPWPGNVRQLKHALTYADAMADAHEQLQPHHLPEEIQSAAAIPAHNTALVGQTVDPAPGKATVIPVEETTTALHDHSLQLIEQALQRCQGNVSRAADQLGIARSTIYRKLASKRSSH